MTNPGGKPESKRMVCGICGILLGAWGVHRFLLGDVTGGIIRIVLSFLCGIGWVISVIEGIMYLMKSDEEFIQTYQIGKKAWF